MSVGQELNPLTELCRYYLACLARDDDRDLSAFASSKRGTRTYVELHELPVISDSKSDVWDDPSVDRFLEMFLKERRQQALYVGYPVHLVHIQARSGWEGFLVQPIAVFETQYGPSTPHPIVMDARPELNLTALGALSGISVGETLDESIGLQVELGLDKEVIAAEDLPDILSSLQEIRPDWPWREHLDPLNVDPDLPLSAIETAGIYNRAVLLTSEQSRYTRGLETELRALETKEQSESKGTALEWWIDRPVPESPGWGEHRTVLEVFPLNTEQRTAVQRALTRPLTVVTGPPGTGKSQVVANIVANCAWRGQKVLVASKNNKAVDVVEERVNSIGQRPLLLRLGSNQYQTRLVEYFSTLLSATSDSEDEANYERCFRLYKSQIQERGRVLAQLDDLIKQRNQLDDLEKQIEQTRDILGEETFTKARELDLGSAAAAVREAENSARRAAREHQGILTRLVWQFIRTGRLNEASSAARELDWLNHELSLPVIPRDEEDGAPILEALKRLRERLEYIPEVQRYYSMLEHLRQQPSTTDVTRSIMKVSERLRSTCARLWQLWLQVQPSRLTAEDRKLLGDYKALLEMRMSADRNNELVSRHAFREFMQMFPKLAELLPAWAVTNLSARGRLPFEPKYFDLVVIDEASQCDIASALPLLYRSKRAVIIGDPKQLRHITHIPVQANHLLMKQHRIHDIGASWGYPNSSLYDLAASLSDGPVVELRDHHRSDEQIIGFSNKHFYEDRLRVATDHEKLRSPDFNKAPLRWRDVKGSVSRPNSGSAINHEEAVSVVDELEQLLVRAGYSGSVGVVTPFRAQANRIRELVHQSAGVMKTIGTSDLLIDTVYKFQGDERDVIVFSPVVSRNTPNSTLRFLDKNANTFNVAVTRARAALVVVGDHASCASCGVRHLEAFAHYASDGMRASSTDNSLGEFELGPEYPFVSNPEQVSQWERWFYRVLYERGLRPIPQYKVEHFDVDFALLNGNHKLAIEIDGEHYHRTWTGELARRDQIRNARLIEMGWDVERFWVYQIRDDTDYCVRRILDWYHR